MSKRLKYKIFKPNRIKKDLDVIFLLHGYGSNEEDLFSLKDFIPHDHIVISLRAPISIGFNSYAWYSINFENNIDRWFNKDEAVKSKNIIIKDILLHMEDLDLKKKRVSILGFSQGAILCWSLGVEHPNLIKRILPLSGFYNSEITDYNLNSNLKIECFSSHGTHDPVIPISWAKKGVEFIKKENINITFKEYDSGHEISNENLSDLIDWLNKN